MPEVAGTARAPPLSLPSFVLHPPPSPPRHMTPPRPARRRRAPSTATRRRLPSSLSSLPKEILLQYILPHLTIKDVLLLCRTSKRFVTVLNEDSFWRRRILTDFPDCPAFLHSGRREPGWMRKVYLGLRHPRAFVWDEWDGGAPVGFWSKLGQGGGKQSLQHVSHRSNPTTFPATEVTDLFPKYTEAQGVFFVRPNQTPELIRWASNDDIKSTFRNGRHAKVKPVDLVQLSATGHQLVARDSRGGLWRLGPTADSTDPEAEVDKALAPWTTAARPIPLPTSVSQVVGGSDGFLALDQNPLVLEQLFDLDNWSHAYRHSRDQFSTLGQLASDTEPPRISKVSKGSTVSACLLSNYTILAWIPSSPTFQETFKDLKGHLALHNEELFMSTVKKGTEPGIFRLPPLPSDPTEFSEAVRGEGGKTSSGSQRVTAIACCGGRVLALKATGSVWMTSKLKTEKLERGSVVWQLVDGLSLPSTTHIYANPYGTEVAAHGTTTQLPDGSWTQSNLVIGSVRIGKRPPLFPRHAVSLVKFQDLPIVQVAFAKRYAVALTAGGAVYTVKREDLLDPFHPGKVHLRHCDIRDATGSPVFFYSITCGAMHNAGLALGDTRIQVYAPPLSKRERPIEAIAGKTKAEEAPATTEAPTTTKNPPKTPSKIPPKTPKTPVKTPSKGRTFQRQVRRVASRLGLIDLNQARDDTMGNTPEWERVAPVSLMPKMDHTKGLAATRQYVNDAVEFQDGRVDPVASSRK